MHIIGKRETQAMRDVLFEFNSKMHMKLLGIFTMENQKKKKNLKEKYVKAHIELTWSQ